MLSTKTKETCPVFNNKFEILDKLGEGTSAKVYLARSLTDPEHHIALKVIQDEYLNRSRDTRAAIASEISIT